MLALSQMYLYSTLGHWGLASGVGAKFAASDLFGASDPLDFHPVDLPVSRYFSVPCRLTGLGNSRVAGEDVRCPCCWEGHTQRVK